jgi:GWxTD domain-containing protein
MRLWTRLLYGLLSIAAGTLAAEKLGAVSDNHADWDPVLFQNAYRLIVTDEEARILDKLANDQLKGFLELFWKIRDPTPTTDANEFKKQFEERIRVAMDSFHEVLPPRLWDLRGDIFIKFGPPDNIEDGVKRLAYGANGQDAYAGQVWWYYSRDIVIPLGQKNYEWQVLPFVDT